MARLSKKAKKRRTLKIIIIVAVALIVIAAAVLFFRKRVATNYNTATNSAAESFVARRGSISTAISTSGSLEDEDVEDIKIYSTVELDDIKIEEGDTINRGDILATVNLASVLSASSEVQQKLDSLDGDIAAAAKEQAATTIKTALSGRVKKLFATVGDDIPTVMQQGALAILSLDGNMFIDVDIALEPQQQVTVITSDERSYVGTVSHCDSLGSRILLTDDGPAYLDSATVALQDGTAVATGVIDINQPLKIIGYAGTVKSIRVRENQQLKANSVIFELSDTAYNANYTDLLKQRSKLEQRLLELIELYRDGAIYAPISGSVSTVDEGAAADEDGLKTLFSVCPGRSMTVRASVDESDILLLKLNQRATVTLDALDGDSFNATVTDIDTTAVSSQGVTEYYVTVTLDKTDKMLSGMTAQVAITIDGVADALLISSDALHQTSSASYVYTSFDEVTGELGGMVEIKVGMNNDTFVEVLEGLNEGDKVYYFAKTISFFGFKVPTNGAMPNMPNMMNRGGGEH